MSVCKPYVLTAAICDAVKGREIDILSALESLMREIWCE